MKKKKKEQQENADTQQGREYLQSTGDLPDNETSSVNDQTSEQAIYENQYEEKALLHHECHDKISMLEAKLEESNDKFLRLFSEFDNYRKRTNKERIELVKTAAADILSAILPVLDDLERASGISTNDPGAEAVMEGLMLVLNKFRSVLRQKGVEEIKSLGEPFNTDLHEAVTHIPATEDTSKGIVVDELQKGYLLNGKVIRFARVVVAN